MTSSRAPIDRSLLGDVTFAVLLAAAYYVTGRLGLEFATVNRSATAVWPPTGISIAALLLRGRRLWPGVLLGAWFANLPTTGVSFATLGIAIGNTLEAVTAATLVARFAAGRHAFDRALDAIRYCGLAGAASTAISATIGVTALWLHGSTTTEAASTVWLTWWLGDLAGAVLVAPAILLARSGASLRMSRAKTVEAAGLLLLIVAVGFIVFGGVSPLPDPAYPIQFLCAPLLVWAACRFDRFATTLALLATAGIAIWGTVKGIGPFVWTSPNESLLLLQAFMSVAALSTLILAAAVHERNAAQSALQATADDLARSNADLERFAHAASHDLKEPLRTVVSFTQLLATRYRGRLDPDADEFIGYSVQAAARLEKLIDDLLAYAHAGADGRLRAPRPAADALQQATALLKASIDAAGATVTQDPLPIVPSDAGQMAQLFQNLLSNSLKFRGPEPPRVHVSARRDGSEWTFTVRDNGIGIDPRFATRVFTMFQRLHQRAEYDGSGIGLAMCKRIVERHGGRIWVESQVGAGATFLFTWPAADEGLDRST